MWSGRFAKLAFTSSYSTELGFFKLYFHLSALGFNHNYKLQIIIITFRKSDDGQWSVEGLESGTINILCELRGCQGLRIEVRHGQEMQSYYDYISITHPIIFRVYISFIICYLIGIQ